MTDYIQKLLQRFVVEKDQKQYRLDPEDPYREAEQYRAEGLNDLRRSVRRLESVLSRETPHVYPDERLALIRTVTTIPEIFTKEEAEALRKTHYIHEQGKVCNLNPDYRMLLMGFDRKREEIRQIRESGCTEEHGEYLDAMEEVMNLIQEFADRYRQAAVEAGNQVVAKAGPGTNSIGRATV